MTNKLHAAVVAVLVAGCAGVPVSEIRDAQVIHSRQAARSPAEMFACMTNRFGDIRDDRLQATALPGGGAEILFGAMQFGSYRYFYTISIDGNDKGSRTVARWSGAETLIISADEIRSAIDRCATTAPAKTAARSRS